MPSMTYQSVKNNLYPKDILKVSGEGYKSNQRWLTDKSI